MRILELHLRTRWLDDTARFYGETLGFPTQRVSDNEIAIQMGWSSLHFTQDDSGAAPFYHFAVNVPPNQLDDTQLWLARRAKLLGNETGERFFFPFWEAEAIYIEDPNGNIVEWMARKGVGTASSEPFTPQSVICISEIGLPVNEFSAIDRSLRRQLGVQHTVEPKSDISIIGDETGSIVIVFSRRGWMPTGREAEIHPLKAHLSGQQQAHVSFAALPYRITMERDA